MILNRIAAAACATCILVAPPAFASGSKQTIYTCNLKVNRSQSWIPNQVVISVNNSDGKVTVFDPIIRHFMTNPISAKVVVNTAERLTVKWTMKRINKVKPDSVPNFEYVAKINKNDQRIAIYGTPLGYDNRFYSDGVCIVK